MTDTPFWKKKKCQSRLTSAINYPNYPQICPAKFTPNISQYENKTLLLSSGSIIQTFKCSKSNLVHEKCNQTASPPMTRGILQRLKHVLSHSSASDRRIQALQLDKSVYLHGNAILHPIFAQDNLVNQPFSRRRQQGSDHLFYQGGRDHFAC